MGMFGGKHYSNPAVGRMHEKMDGVEHSGAEEGSAHVEGGHPHSVHGHFHEDGTAHVHVHHADGSHEHMDHPTHEAAHDHMTSAMNGESQMPEQEEDGEEHMNMKEAVSTGHGAY